MRKPLIFLLVLFFTICEISAQNKKIDSIENLVGSSLLDSTRINLQLKIAELTYDEFPLKTISYAKQAIILAEKNDLQKKLGLANQYLGLAYETLTKHDSARIYYNKARVYRKNDSILLGVTLMSLGGLEKHAGNPKKGLDFLLQALKIFDIKNNDRGRGRCYIFLGNFYYEQYKDSLALKSYMEALKIHQKLNDEKTMAYDYQNIGNMYNSFSQYKKADGYFKKALPLFEKEDNKQSLASCLVATANNCIHDKRFAEAKKFLIKADTILQLLGDKRLLVFNNNNLADIAISDGDFVSAEKYLLKSEKICFESSLKGELKETYLSFANMYEKKGDFKKAFQSQRKYGAIKDSIFTSENNRQINEMQTKFETEKKDKELIKKNAEIKIGEANFKKQSFQRNALILGFILMVLLSLFIFRSLQRNKKKNKIITEQKNEVEKQKNIIEEHRKEIIDSINYAKRIQTALLASDKILNDNLKEYFVLFKPKDIVAGDFYWASESPEGFIFITADCTGHGVPGAFMSLLNISKLNESINQKKILRPDLILNDVRSEIVQALNPKGSTEESKDGMDAILCKLDLKNMSLEFAAANNSFYIIRNKTIFECRADKMPVGKGHNDSLSFTFNTIPLHKGDMIYTFTDGYADQFGGPKGKKLKYKQMEQLMVSICEQPMQAQKQVLDNFFEQWKGGLEQVDDVLIMGIKV